MDVFSNLRAQEIAEASAHRLAKSLTAQAQSVISMLDDLIDEADNKYHARWWHRFFPGPEKARRQRRAEERAALNRSLDAWAEQLAADERDDIPSPGF